MKNFILKNLLITMPIWSLALADLTGGLSLFVPWISWGSSGSADPQIWRSPDDLDDLRSGDLPFPPLALVINVNNFRKVFLDPTCDLW